MKNKELDDRLSALGKQINSAVDLAWNDIQDVIDGATEADDKDALALVYYYAAYYMLNSGKHKECLLYLNYAFKYSYDSKPGSVTPECYHMLGLLAHSQNNLFTAMDSYAKAGIYAKEEGKEILHSIIMANMAEIYHVTGVYEKALKYYGVFLDESSAYDLSREKQFNLLKKLLAEYGHCLIMADRMTKAKVLESELQLVFSGRENDYTTKLAVYEFYAFMSYKRGESEKMRKFISLAIDSIADGCVLAVCFHQVSILIQFLVECKEFDALEKVLNIVEPQAAVEEDEGFLQKLLVHRLKFCSDKLSSEDYLKSAQSFFQLKDRFEYAESDSVRQMVELRTRLESMEEEQIALEEEGEKLLYRARHDELSGLYNRRYLNLYMSEMFEEALAQEVSLGVLFVDIDFFKQMNDHYGHQKGDECIRTLADCIRKQMPEDFAARYGGDEFVILAKGRSMDELRECATSLVNMVRKLGIPNEKGGVNNVMTVTIGATYGIPKKTQKVWDYLSEADSALYQQKNTQKGSVCFTVI